ncbi:MAG TPA: hypothetical protein PKA42_01730 [Candidatus Paceibacterota bacterium]|nr:hypothetical protein [Candidatus Paceibacterota bacterium]HMO82864.1 hypothetical protein [Candidatus Paceibacterota bacterium]
MSLFTALETCSWEKKVLVTEAGPVELPGGSSDPAWARVGKIVAAMGVLLVSLLLMMLVLSCLAP